MPLLKPPAPTVAKRKYYIRIEEPLAMTLPRERNRNCEETRQGSGPLARLPPVALDRTFAVPNQPATMEAKEK